MNYWLFKTEPATFGVDDLARVRAATTAWDGVRNYQVRNMIRDQMRVGDRGFLYHSSCEVPGIVGVMKVTRPGYPDETAFDRKHDHYDPDSRREEPRWYMVDVRLERRFSRCISLEMLRAHATRELAGMQLLRTGNRLSVMPIDAAQWNFILTLE